MKILLDENFPLPLYHRLRTAGFDVEHIIVLGQRGIKGTQLRKRLEEETIILLTQDTEFEDDRANLRGKVIISRVRQNLPIRQRVEKSGSQLWMSLYITRTPKSCSTS